MESSSSASSKRRRLMPIYISSRPRPDLPARFESLNDDTKRLILKFVGGKSYATYAGINKHCKEIYLTTPGMTKETFTYGYAPLRVIIDELKKPFYDPELFERVSKGVVFYNRRDVLAWALKHKKVEVLKAICNIASAEGRIDLLDEVWNHNVNENEDYKRTVFESVDKYAARGGKLEVLKWIEIRQLHIGKNRCATEAAHYGQLHIIKWLQEEKGLQLTEDLYDEAVWGGHLHVMKWLREQACPFHDVTTFIYAAQEGNLDILQFLHDEDCPWPEDVYAYEEHLEPDVIDWLRVNGYGNRLSNDRLSND